MDIIFEESDIVEKNENILIHLFFHLVDYDFRNGFFSNESSIHDMGSSGFTDQDYLNLSQTYYETVPENLTYSEGEKFYRKLSNELFDNMIIDKFEATYGIVIDKKTHLLKDFILVLKNRFPERDWDKDNIFILKTLDNRLEKEEKNIVDAHNHKDEKIVKLPVRKKLTPEEVKNSFKEYLMVRDLGMTWKDARALAEANFDKKMEGKKFEPYIPETVSHISKLKI